MKKCFTMVLLLGLIAACGSLPITKKDKDMNTIEFVPKGFEDVVLEYKNVRMGPCSPGYPQELRVNSLQINMPEKAIFHIKDGCFTPVLPLCIGHTVSYWRNLKFFHSPEMTAHVRHLDAGEVHSGDIYDKSTYGRREDVYDTEQSIAWREREIEDVQKYTNEELNEGTYYERYYNVDLFEFVDLPVKPGTYEVWVTYCGMESNHAIVEIIVK